MQKDHATVFQKIIALLDGQHIQYQLFEHEPVRTSEEAARMRGSNIKQGAKSLIFKADKRSVLLVVGGEKRVSSKKARAVLDCKDLVLATPEEVFMMTGVEVGGVPPLGTVMGLPTYLDQSFFVDNQHMEFNAGDKTKSIAMRVEDYVRIIKPVIVDIS